MFGFRADGRRVTSMDPIVQITPYLMPMRCDAQVFLDYEIDYEPLMRYIAKKNREGHKITFMEILIASYVRAISQLPEANRFVVNKQIFDRKVISVAFTLLLDTDDGSLQESLAKLKFKPTDTLFDISEQVKLEIAKNRRVDDQSNGLVSLCRTLLAIPFLPTFFSGLLKLLDRYGLLPNSLIDILPFHVGLYVTNMASIGMTRVYHHLYNFGTASLFFSIGNVKRSTTINAHGEKVRVCKMPFGITADERICSGAVYAKLFSMIKHGLQHPETLETPPEQVFYAKGMKKS